MNCYKGGSCPKSGIKIHEYPNKNEVTRNSQLLNIDNIIMNKNSNLVKPVDFYNTTLDTLDLDINNYSLNDLYKLFNIDDNFLTDISLKDAKQIVLKMHPDKSKLDAKYFLFFSKAYKTLF